jgi:hypothetical protein
LILDKLRRIKALKLHFLDRVVLALATLFLGLIALPAIFVPEVAKAQSDVPLAHVYIEPGVHIINAPDNSRRVLGKIVVDLSNGNVWGFPTNGDSLYPLNTDPARNTPPTSTPILLGRYDFSTMVRK